MSDLLKPCMKCGVLSPTTTCPEHTIVSERYPKGNTTQRGYGSAWQKLSRRARRLQPFCTKCGSNEDLTLDHSEEAWEAFEAGKPITLALVTVLCRSCNSQKGQARPNNTERTPTVNDGGKGLSGSFMTPGARHNFSYTPRGYPNKEGDLP